MRQLTILFGVVALAFVLAPAKTILGAGQGYSTAEVMDVVKSLGKTIEMPEEKIGDLVQNLKTVTSDSWYSELVRGRPVSAVLVYRSTEAGFIYKRRNGHGTIAFKDSPTRVPFTLSGSSFGASIGGSAEWGVGLLLDMKNPRDFGGTYAGTEKGATAADSTAPSCALFSNESYVQAAKAHEMVLIISARGLSAGVSKGKITFTPEW